MLTRGIKDDVGTERRKALGRLAELCRSMPKEMTEM